MVGWSLVRLSAAGLGLSSLPYPGGGWSAISLDLSATPKIETTRYVSTGLLIRAHVSNHSFTCEGRPAGGRSYR